MSDDARVQFAPTLADTLPDITGEGGESRRRPPSMPPGYALGPVLGRGGMGEVVLAHDVRIGRDVAIKRMNADDAELSRRFLCEARIQAYLEHPAIVPVHDIGHDAQGNPYFTMKRVAGRTLAELLADPGASNHRALRALVDVCLAVDFAHARGVIHRDLKPANIMLGDYGEVYVLDWGVARILEQPGRAGTVSDDLAHTEVGALLGTPGYAPPEQLLAASNATTAADVYSLGAILFEILTGELLHPSGVSGIASTLNEPTRSPAELNPRVAPELDALCVRALATAPEDRPSARALADGLQQYLDGDRDTERRRSLAMQHLEVARGALASGDPERRGEAIRAASRALALDAESEASALLASLLADTRPEVPSVASQVERVETECAAKSARRHVIALTTTLLYIPFILWSGVRQPMVIVALLAYVALQVLFTYRASVAVRAPGPVAFGANIVLALVLERMFSPFLVVPMLLLGYTVLSVPKGPLADRRGWLFLVPVLSLLLPIGLEAAGLLASTWSIHDGALVIRSAALSFGGPAGLVLLIVVHLGPLVIATWFGRARTLRHRAALWRFELQNWKLQQLATPVPRSGPRPVLLRP